MRILRRLRGGSTATSVGVWRLACTTTLCADDCAALYAESSMPDGGFLELDGRLEGEPWNEHDRGAVAVYVDHHHVGYLPQHGVDDIRAAVAKGGRPKCALRLFAKPHEGRLRVVGYVRVGDGHEWPFGEGSWPPVTPDEDRRHAAAYRRAETQRRLADPYLGTETAMGMVTADLHYTDVPDIVRELKREGRYEEALVWCYRAIEATERENPAHPAPAYTEYAAIIHRKLGDLDQEVAVLERYLRRFPESTWLEHKAGERREKALALIAKRESR